MSGFSISIRERKGEWQVLIGRRIVFRSKVREDADAMFDKLLHRAVGLP